MVFLFKLHLTSLWKQLKQYVIRKLQFSFHILLTSERVRCFCKRVIFIPRALTESAFCFNTKMRPFSMLHAHLFSNSIDKRQGETFSNRVIFILHALSESVLNLLQHKTNATTLILYAPRTFVFKFYWQVKGWDFFFTRRFS